MQTLAKVGAEEIRLPNESKEWIEDLKQGARSIEDLVGFGFITAKEARSLLKTASKFKFQVGRYYLSLIDRNDPDCPIRRQAIPSHLEMQFDALERTDPVGDDVHRVTPLLIHRYTDRVLLMPTLNCPMYCRYCFRKVGINDAAPSFMKYWSGSLDYLKAHPEVKEVILSGGDPLMASNATLKRVFEGLREVKHLRRVRVHTRVPVTLPSRVTKRLLSIFASSFPVYVVTHFNHSKELTSQTIEALNRLRSSGAILANQSVLLKGVNDNADTLRRLCLGLLDHGVRPYYIHHPDITIGTSHLRVSLIEGQRIYRELQGSMSGLSIPSYVMEIPGGGGKVRVDSDRVVNLGAGRWRLESPLDGTWSQWTDPAHVRIESKTGMSNKIKRAVPNE